MDATYTIQNFAHSDDWAKMVELQKMVLVYNAVNDGWSVTKLGDGQIEFKKDLQRFTSGSAYGRDFLKNFMNYYLRIG